MAENYHRYREICHKIVVSLYEDEAASRRLFFEFYLHLLLSIRSSLSSKQLKTVHEQITKFYNYSSNEVDIKVEEIEKFYPQYSLEEENKYLVVEILKELKEVCECYCPDSPHVYGEGLAFTPQVLGYPENMALAIFSHLGFKVDC